MLTYFVYILSSHTGTLYTGMTADLPKRIECHKAGKGSRFSAKYEANSLVHVEPIDSLEAAREREAQIKRWSRRKKIQLIDKFNPRWRDLSNAVD
jgi:putative endonuclease